MAYKGAIELSWSFIVTVIFAVVLLSLGLTLFRDIFAGITDLTKDMRQKASQELDDTFSSTEGVFDIYPKEYAAKAGTKISVTIGAKNNADDGEAHRFAANIIVSETPSGVAEATVSKWISTPDDPKRVPIGSDARFPVDVTIPKDAKKGTYFLTLVACTDYANGRTYSVSALSCRADSENILDTAIDFKLIIE